MSGLEVLMVVDEVDDGLDSLAGGACADKPGCEVGSADGDAENSECSKHKQHPFFLEQVDCNRNGKPVQVRRVLVCLLYNTRGTKIVQR